MESNLAKNNNSNNKTMPRKKMFWTKNLKGTFAVLSKDCRITYEDKWPSDTNFKKSSRNYDFTILSFTERSKILPHSLPYTSHNGKVLTQKISFWPQNIRLLWVLDIRCTSTLFALLQKAIVTARKVKLYKQNKTTISTETCSSP